MTDGRVVADPGINGSSYSPVYTDKARPELMSADDWHFFEDWLAPLMASPHNLRGWQMCQAELLAEARATQAYADAFRIYPRDMPYNVDPASEPDDEAVQWAKRAQIMRTAAALAVQANVACIDEPTSAAHWLEFNLKVDGATRKIAVPDTYILLYVLETGEQIIRDSKICTPHTHVRWEQINARPVATVEANDGPTFSEREKYRILEQIGAQEDLEIAMGRKTCPSS